MANTKSAKKAIRVSARKRSRNIDTKKSMKESRKDVLKAVKAGDKKKASELLPKAYKEIDKAAKKNVIHKNTAARYKSNLTKVLNGIA